MIAALKIAAVVAAALLGTLLLIGCGIAVMFELDGFGRRDADPRPLYLAALTLGAALCVAAPVALSRALFPARRGG